MQFTRENTLRGLRLRIMIWISLLSKTITKHKSTSISYPHPVLRCKIVENTTLLLNYMKEIVDELEDKKVQAANSYDWQKHIRITWNGDEQACKVEIGAFTVQQQNEYLGHNARYCFLYPLTEKIFVNISSSLREKSGIVVSSHSSFGADSEIFEEFANLCATPMQKLFCYANLPLKQALQFVNASALSGVWILFGCFEFLPAVILATLSKEIQMVQQQFIIAEMEHDQQEEVEKSREGSSGQINDSNNKQNLAVIEKSRSSLQIKRKKAHKETSKMEADAPGKEAKTRTTDPKLPQLSKSCFGVFATVSNDYLHLHCNEEALNCLKGAFRLTSVTYIPPEIYLQNLLKGKNFLDNRKITQSILAYYSKLATYSSCRTISIRSINQILILADRLRNASLFLEKNRYDIPRNSKAIANFESFEKLLFTEEMINPKINEDWVIKIERTAIGEALYLFEKCRVPHQISYGNWNTIILNLLQECNLSCPDPQKAIEKADSLVLNTSLQSIARDSTEGLKFIASDFVIDKVIELYEMSLTRKNIILCGGEGSGKSSILNIFCTFLYRLQGQIVKKHVVNFSSESPEFLFGSNKREACILQSIIKDLKEQPNCKPCILFDSDSDSSWIDIFAFKNPIPLAEQILTFPDNTLFLYETLSLANISPKTINQIAVAFIEPDLISPIMVINSSISAIYSKYSEFFASVLIEKEIIFQLLKPIYAKLLDNLPDFNNNHLWTLQSCLRVSFKLLNSFCHYLHITSKSIIVSQDLKKGNFLILSSQVFNIALTKFLAFIRIVCYSFNYLGIFTCNLE